MSNHLERGRNKIMPVFHQLLRLAYIAQSKNKINDREELFSLLDMCINSLMELETTVQQVEDIITSIGFRYYPHNYQVIEQFLLRLLPNMINYELLSLTEDSTNYNSDNN